MTAFELVAESIDLDRLEAARHNIQSMVATAQISQREATKRMMQYAFVQGVNRGSAVSEGSVGEPG